MWTMDILTQEVVLGRGKRNKDSHVMFRPGKEDVERRLFKANRASLEQYSDDVGFVGQDTRAGAAVAVLFPP